MCIHDLILVLYYKEFVAVCIGADSVSSCKLQRKIKTFVFVYLCGIYLQTSFFGREVGNLHYFQLHYLFATHLIKVGHSFIPFFSSTNFWMLGCLNDYTFFQVLVELSSAFLSLLCLIVLQF
jgi:hypothetical protein